MGMDPRLLRPRQTGFDPRSISGLALWLDAADSQTLYTTDAGPVTAVSAPTEISGCVGWWDASDASSITQSGGLVSQWNDKSGNGNHATASGTERPTHTAGGLNGLSVMTFDGTANSMAVAANAAFNSNDLTYFVVFRQTSAAMKGVYTKLTSSAGTSGFGLAARSDPQVWTLQKNASQQPVLAANVSPISQARIYSVTSSASAAQFLDGLQTATAASSADHSLNATVRIGSREGTEFLNGYIAEIIHFNAALSPADRARVERYLAAKWGISGVHAPATATNDPVGAWLDKSGNGRHATQATGSDRPAVSATAQNGRRAIAFDGSTDWMRTERTNYLARTVVTVFRRTATATNSFMAVFAKQTGVAVGYGGSSYVSNTEGGWSTVSSASGRMYYNSSAVPHRLSAAYMRGALMPLADAQSPFGGIAAATTTTQPELLYAEAATDSGNQVWFIGTEPFATTRKYPADVLELMIYSRVLSTAERQHIERYLAAKWGITLAPQVSNADAQDWVNRVYANGGTVSAATANAVNQFCVDIANAGIRDRFYRLNLFCGNSDASLAAVRTPLFRGPSLTGTQYGNAIDTNAGNLFVANDYAETGASGGLIGNGTSKYLDTGFAMNTLPITTSGHASVYCPNRSSITDYRAMVGVLQNALTGFGASTDTTLYSTWGNHAFAVNQTNGLLVASRTSATSNVAYANGAVVATNANSVTPTASSLSAVVFAARQSAAVNFHDPRRYCSYSIGSGLTGPEVTAFTNAMQAFQTALGRQV